MKTRSGAGSAQACTMHRIGGSTAVHNRIREVEAEQERAALRPVLGIAHDVLTEGAGDRRSRGRRRSR